MRLILHGVSSSVSLGSLKKEIFPLNMQLSRRSLPFVDLLLFLGAIVVASSFCYWILSLLLPASSSSSSSSLASSPSPSSSSPRRSPLSREPSVQDDALWAALHRMRLYQQRYHALLGIPANATEARLEGLLSRTNLTLRETLLVEPVVLQLRQWLRLQGMLDRLPGWIEGGMGRLSEASQTSRKADKGKMDDGRLMERLKVLETHFGTIASDLQRATLGIQALGTQCHRRIEENFVRSPEDGLVRIVDNRPNRADNATWIQNMKQDIGELVRKIESSDEDTFRMLQKGGAAHMETVIQLSPLSSSSSSSPLADPSLLGNHTTHPVALQIIDTHNNRFVLARPANLALLGEDAKLLHEILLLVVVALAMGAVSETVGLPSFLGYLAAGTMLGPSCLNRVQNLVQMSTLGQLGLLFIVLSLGLHFSLDTMRAVWKTSVLLVVCLTIFSIILCVLAGNLIFEMAWTQSTFIGLILSLSSTAVAIKCLQRGDPQAIQTASGQLILGLLILQDVIFFAALALLPHLCGSAGMIKLFGALASLLVSTAVYSLVTMLLINGISRYFAGLWSKLTPLGLVGVILLMTLLGQRLNVSLELGCFIAAVFVGSSLDRHSPSHSHLHPAPAALDLSHAAPSRGDRIRASISGLVEALSILFFLSVGLAIDVRFLWGEKLLLLPLALGICVLKSGVMAGLGRMVAGCEGRVAALVGVDLGQISELALVLGARGRQLGLVSAESYYMIAGVTALGMILTPVLWFLFAWWEGRHCKY